MGSIKKLHSAYVDYSSWALRIKDLLCYLELWPIIPSSPPAYTSEVMAHSASADTQPQAFEAECRKRSKTAAIIRSFLSDALYPKYAAERFDDPEVLWEQIKIDSRAGYRRRA
jgi:hypothetical protein